MPVIRKTRCMLCGSKEQPLFKFPDKIFRLKLWFKIIGMEEFLKRRFSLLKTNARLCKAHFQSTLNKELALEGLPQKTCEFSPSAHELFLFQDPHPERLGSIDLEMQSTSQDVAVITLSDSDNDSRPGPSSNKGSSLSNNEMGSIKTQTNSDNQSRTVCSSEEDDISFIAEVRHSSQQPDILVSRDDSIIATPIQTHQENVPNTLSQLNNVLNFGRKARAKKPKKNSRLREVPMTSSGLNDPINCEVTSTTREYSPSVFLPRDNEVNKTGSENIHPAPDFIPLNIKGKNLLVQNSHSRLSVFKKINISPSMGNTKKSKSPPVQNARSLLNLFKKKNVSPNRKNNKKKKEISAYQALKRKINAIKRNKKILLKCVEDSIAYGAGFEITSLPSMSVNTHPVLTNDTNNPCRSVTLPNHHGLNNAIRIPNLSQPRTLRPIVIDGSNVACAHGEHNKTYSCKGIKLCINYFLNRGHTQVIAFVPRYRRDVSSKKRNPTVGRQLLENLVKKKLVVYTPSRMVNGIYINSYDDRFMIQYATQHGGVIVTNDRFLDLIDEDESYRAVIFQRCLPFVFVGDEFFVLDHPSGLLGPCLKDILAFPPDEHPPMISSSTSI